MVDGVELTANVWELARDGAGSFAAVPILMGSNRDEGALFIKDAPPPGLPQTATAAQLTRWATDWADAGTARAIEQLYPRSLYPYASATATAGFYAGDRAWGDMQMVCNVGRAGHAHEKER